MKKSSHDLRMVANLFFTKLSLCHTVLKPICIIQGSGEADRAKKYSKSSATKCLLSN